MTDVNINPLFIRRNIKNRLIIVVASDRGLAGGYNASLLKEFAAELKKDKANGVKNRVITVGKKATAFTAKVHNWK